MSNAVAAPSARASDDQRCNICGGTIFLPGPGGRKSTTGLDPRCSGCQSLERHRTLRAFYLKLRQVLDLASMSCLQISEDRCVEPGWFASRAVSVYGGRHSLDIQELPFGTGAFDCVICNHVLEHVPDDRRAMAELFRVVGDRGFLQFGVPDPARLAETRDWGHPDWSDHGHFRKYGIDILDKIRPVIGDGALLQVRELDPVTGMDDLYFILTRATEVAGAIATLYPDAVVEAGGRFGALPGRGPLLAATTAFADPEAFLRYVGGDGHQTVEGWVAPGALTAITGLEAAQRALGVRGHVCEIGVHHGRYFITLSLMRTLGERSLAIDVFERQEFNVDKSGLGDRAQFEANVATWLGSEPEVEILSGDSLSVSGDQIIARLGGRVRLFSVDGSHTVQHTLNDIGLAASSLAPGGIAIIDDFLNPAWPGVVEAIVQYLGSDRPGKLEPIGYGDNKFYLTTPGFAARYAEALSGPLAGLAQQTKAVSLCGQPMVYVAMQPIAQGLRAAPIGENAALKVCGTSSTPLPGLIGGRSFIETGGTWLLGRWAGLALTLPDDSGCSLELHLHCFHHERDPEPRVQVFAAGREVAIVEFGTGADLRVVAIPVASRALGASRRLELWFHNPRAESPAATGRSTDTRRLLAFLGAVRHHPASSIKAPAV